MSKSNFNISQLKDMYLTRYQNQNQNQNLNFNTEDDNNIDGKNKVILKEIRPGNLGSSCPNGGISIKNNDIEMTLCAAASSLSPSPLPTTPPSNDLILDSNNDNNIIPNGGGIELKSVIDNNIAHPINLPHLSQTQIQTKNFPSQLITNMNPNINQFTFDPTQSRLPDELSLFVPAERRHIFDLPYYPMSQPPQSQFMPPLPSIPQMQMPIPHPTTTTVSISSSSSWPQSQLAGRGSGQGQGECNSCTKRNSCSCNNKLKGCDYCRSGGRRPGCLNCHNFYNRFLFNK
jgi:hypothetical protein